MSTNNNYFWIEKKFSNRRFIKSIIVKVYVINVYLQLQLILKKNALLFACTFFRASHMPYYSCWELLGIYFAFGVWY